MHDWSKWSTDQYKHEHDKQKYFNCIAGTGMQHNKHNVIHIAVERASGIESDFIYGTARTVQRFVISILQSFAIPSVRV